MGREQLIAGASSGSTSQAGPEASADDWGVWPVRWDGVGAWARLGLVIGVFVATVTALSNGLPFFSRDGVALLALSAAFYALAAAFCGCLLRLPLVLGLGRRAGIRPERWHRGEWLIRALVFWLFVSLLVGDSLAAEPSTRGRALLAAVGPALVLAGLSFAVRARTVAFSQLGWLPSVLALGVGLLASGLSPASPRPPGSGPRAGARLPVPKDEPRRRILLVGLDGLDPRVLRSMLERGELPHLRGLVSRGASGEVTTLTPTFSPIIWTTVATGKLPDKHGIRGFVHSLPGVSQPIHSYPFNVGYQQMLGLLMKAGLSQTLLPASSMRRGKALWNILAETGRRVGIVNWWASWPAEEVGPGIIVTDRLFYHSHFAPEERVRSGLVSPGTLYPELSRLVVREADVPSTQVDDVLRATGEASRGAEVEEYVAPRARFWLALDQTHLGIALRLLQTGPFDLFAVYLRGPDLAGHTMTWMTRNVNEAAAWRMVEESYRGADRALGRLLESVPQETTVVVCSDHGFGRQPEGTFDHRDAPAGVLILAGPDIEPGAKLVGARVADIGTTILHLLGYPVAQDMDGRVLLGALRPEVRRTTKVARVPSYETAVRQVGFRSSPADAEVEEQLRSLGYIQ